MRRHTILYTIALLLLLLIILLLHKTYNEIRTYSQLTNRQNTVHGYLKELSSQINKATTFNPDMLKRKNHMQYDELFYVDSTEIIQQLQQLRSTIQDSLNVQIVGKLIVLISSEISWILKSNVPDSIMHNRSSGHVASLKTIDSLISQGTERTNFLISHLNAHLNKQFRQARLWIIFFVALSGVILVYSTVSFFKQLSKTVKKEKELETVLNRVDDGVVSLDKNWRYTFLNDAAIATHPQGKEKTLGKFIWQIHPELKNTLFWERFQEAMHTKKVVEMEGYYPPMSRWFSVKAYPSVDSLTIFFRDLTDSKRAEIELSQTLKEVSDYKYALDESSIVAITDEKGIILYANDNFCKISKYSKEELIGQDHRIVNSGYHPKSYIKNLWETIANGKIWRGEFRNRAKDGSIYWVDATIIPFLDVRNMPYQYLAIRTDITERKLAEEKILKSEEQYRDLIENITDLICTHDLNGRILSVNSAAERLIGRGFDPQENLNIRDILAPDKKDEFNDYITKIKKEGRVQGLMKVRAFSGKFHTWEYNNSLKTEGVDTPIVRGYARDITESRMAEDALRKSNERFKYAAQATLDIIWELNFETKQYMVHEGAEKLFGIDRKLDWKFGVEGEYIIEEDRERVKKSFRDARMDPACELWTDEYRVWSIEKNILNIINHAILIRDRKGKVIRAIGAITDVTEKKKLQKELLEQQKREQLKITATALEAQEKERNAIGVELHDNVNQILVGTKILLSTVKLDPDRMKSVIDLCVKNLQDAIDENRKIAHALVTPDLETDTLAEQLKKLTSNMLKSAGLESEVDAANYKNCLLSKEMKIAIYRIAQEQCTNIMKYAKASKMKITINNTDKNFRMLIADNGMGMEEGKKSSGIGLSNINSRLSVINGTSNIVTAPGKGFSLEIEIPL